ncbi:metal ABC transporter substrate-binding protein [Desulfosporosinus sp. BICA1-9]|uniref:metal ABC transporter substrate-binding protein n=1 Tax=Desulfosporosinus sp. BICA1-9 TaxID=1531958 RepID=UPI00054BFE59|nr:metal ABC transporter substrate-binding protein [Desulfosporosinus sp. BICA1-9]KJS47037.1 MAG: metal ABC transporter substrate-binding protein [Peptococcaceae bacterium BRH_c23]KJS86448.1 MAG: metal ABC transporter substrate-binding protein [Desulfosporosinus sp. BICA1-9]
MDSKKPKILGLVLVSVLAMVLVLSGCGTDNESKAAVSQTTDTKTEKVLTIATSFYPMHIFTLNIAKDIPDVNVVSLTKPTTGCLHDYAVTPDDMKNLEGAQILVINGAGMESFMDKVTSQMPDLKIIESSQGITLIEGDGDEGDNPHVWLSITDAITQVKTIGDQLASLDPTNALKYQENTQAYIKKLEALRTKMHQSLDGVQQRNIVTFHEAFPYFAKEFNLTIAGVIEREPGSAPNAKELSETIEQVKSLKIKALFAEPQYPTKAADSIAKETGAKVYTLDPIVTGPIEADAYINLMESNLIILQEALK